MGNTEDEQPGFINAFRPVVFRAYKIENEWFGNGKTVDELESYFDAMTNDSLLNVFVIKETLSTILIPPLYYNEMMK